jgi:hypothetical protein
VLTNKAPWRSPKHHPPPPPCTARSPPWPTCCGPASELGCSDCFYKTPRTRPKRALAPRAAIGLVSRDQTRDSRGFLRCVRCSASSERAEETFCFRFF